MHNFQKHQQISTTLTRRLTSGSAEYSPPCPSPSSTVTAMQNYRFSRIQFRTTRVNQRLPEIAEIDFQQLCMARRAFRNTFERLVWKISPRCMQSTSHEFITRCTWINSPSWQLVVHFVLYLLAVCKLGEARYCGAPLSMHCRLGDRKSGCRVYQVFNVHMLSRFSPSRLRGRRNNKSAVYGSIETSKWPTVPLRYNIPYNINLRCLFRGCPYN